MASASTLPYQSGVWWPRATKEGAIFGSFVCLVLVVLVSLRTAAPRSVLPEVR